MARRPLLAELHAHTTWSDGVLTPRELVDLYGLAGFDVLAITDHVVRAEIGCHVRAETYRDYLDELDTEAERARRRFGMLVVPGLELTVESRDPSRAGHALAVGLREFVSVDGGLEAALREALDLGAALIGVHPYSLEAASESIRVTAWFAEHAERAAEVVDRFELFNREESFPWVAERKLPFVATGDFHAPEHLLTWKTLLTCKGTEDAVVDRLRSSAPCALMRITAGRIAA
jgi:predicted metal-dependent phosphoesterase TrpH